VTPLVCGGGRPDIIENEHFKRSVPLRSKSRGTSNVSPFFSQTSVLRFRQAYRRLEGTAFQRRERRPFLTILGRLDIHAVYGDLRLQVAGAVSEESAIRFGRLMGADTYYIDAPTFHDRALATACPDSVSTLRTVAG